tara:strand:- start:2683 stop:3351 length:669 start_codon:yes stop_codon:yes gene_type:complete
MNNVQDIRNHFIRALVEENFTTDRTGSKTIELLGASFIATESAIFGTVNEDYVQQELEWYDSESTNIYDICNEPPQAWKMTANDHGEINSNYGNLVYNDKHYNQYNKVLNELRNNPDSRRASMVYQRPSIWVDYKENGKNDFICTNAVTYYIRDDQLHCVVQMRSNDVVFGYKNDFAWQEHILYELCEDLNDYQFRAPLAIGDIHWQVQNLHVYERHFDLVK